MFVDISFDMRSDAGGKDPDSYSATLRSYHRYLWSKKLPNGKIMDLYCGFGANYLTWKDFRFGSDSIIVSFRYLKNRALIEDVAKALPDYRSFVEDYVHKAYTIGGMMIFPKHSGSINQRRGTHHMISDRWDLTLECIRRFYSGEDSPLLSTLERDKAFFNLFVDFRGYVDYFLLQDCVSSDYTKVKIWLGKGDFNENPLPQSVEQYLSWIDAEMEFLGKRNKRIKEYVNRHKKIQEGPTHG